MSGLFIFVVSFGMYMFGYLMGRNTALKQLRQVERAAVIRERLGWNKTTEEQQVANLNYNLDEWYKYHEDK